MENITRILIPPLSPIESGRMEEWLAVEHQLGVSLPTDYKDYVTTFGTGYISEFIWIFNPFAQNKSLNLIEQVPIRLDAVKEIKHQLPNDVPFKIFPERGGLLPCGATGNGDCLYWLTEGHPNEWPIVVNESRGPDWMRFDMQITDFLAGILNREIICDIFPPEFPGGQVVFESRS